MSSHLLQLRSKLSVNLAEFDRLHRRVGGGTDLLFWYISIPDKAKPAVRRGRKATDLERPRWPSCRRKNLRQARLFCFSLQRIVKIKLSVMGKKAKIEH